MFIHKLVNSLTNQSRCIAGVGVKPLTSLTEDELTMKETGKVSCLHKRAHPTNFYFATEPHIDKSKKR